MYGLDGRHDQQSSAVITQKDGGLAGKRNSGNAELAGVQCTIYEYYM